MKPIRRVKNLFQKEKINPRDYVILALYLLRKRGIEVVSETRLHKIIYFARNKIEELKKYKFSERPIHYSYGLYSDLNELILKGYVEYIPGRYEYRLSYLVGPARALEILEHVPEEKVEVIENAIEQVFGKN